MNTEQAVVKVTEVQTENSGFCLQQALAWVQKCFLIGAAEMAAVDDVAAANVKRMVASGEAHIEAKIDMSQQSCAFIFHMDQGGENAREIRMFTQFLAPDTPTSSNIN